mmetsp:Transcript_9774/g.17653  ORF Transcript_9774/g.17653 Transcript_9774/m.17653 type:complete len:151 (+) Transcript_9774:62-514(+)
MASEERRRLLSSKLNAKARSVNAFLQVSSRPGGSRPSSIGGSRSSSYTLLPPNLSKVHAVDSSPTADGNSNNGVVGTIAMKIPQDSGDTATMHRSSSSPALEVNADISSPAMRTRQQRCIMKREAFLAAATDAFCSFDNRSRKQRNRTAH